MAVIKSTGYTIVTGNTALTAVSTFLKKQNYASQFILCDENTLQHCLPVLISACPGLASAEIIEVESGEDSKSMEVSVQILHTLMDARAGRNALFVNLGGGVVSDLGGFAASIYKRGIDFITIPTSLLAMCDASVGGKNGIDFAGIKNSVGTFAQPKGVFIYPGFLDTLPERHYRNGLAEVYKIALVSNKKFWQQLGASAQKNNEAIIDTSIALKNKIVIKDPFDKGIRKILNFGHTIGHALEALSLGTAQELLHGEAIAIGMIVESHIAFQKKMITRAGLSEITDRLVSVFGLNPLSLLSFEQIMEAMQQDKKRSGSKLLFSLIDGIGSCAIDLPVTESQIKKGMDYYLRLS